VTDSDTGGKPTDQLVDTGLPDQKIEQRYPEQTNPPLTSVGNPLEEEGLSTTEVTEREAPISNIGLGDDHPRILIHPESSENEVSPEPEGCVKIQEPFSQVDTAKSSSIQAGDTNGNGAMTKRNASAAERPTSAASRRAPTTKEESKSILRAIWRTVFVEWIGGLISRFRGTRGRP